MKKIFVLLSFCVMIPFNAFAFDICGWWQLEEKPSIFMKITKEKIYGFHYKTSKETEERVEIFVDNSDIPCYLDKKSDDRMLLVNALGEEKLYRLITRDTSLSQKEVQNLCDMRE
ncbi:hypothetical protein [Desulfovibrio piger]|uniref:hypothetical protein n=1 Tax=Desulfovibrio piger TaxID=901 RepID=UPI00307E4416